MPSTFGGVGGQQLRYSVADQESATVYCSHLSFLRPKTASKLRLLSRPYSTDHVERAVRASDASCVHIEPPLWIELDQIPGPCCPWTSTDPARRRQRLNAASGGPAINNELFTELEQTDLGSLEHLRLFGRIADLLRQDARDEEDVLLPKLQEALDPRSLRRAGLLWLAVRYTAPTRPHPTVERRPPGNALAALPLTALDRSRDRLDQAARRASAPLAARCRGASRALATVAGAVEHLPPLRSGEDPSTRT
ncbi:hemerythrin domain-containing protein [Nocardia brasiliensis]|uniref:hemerythrin domain-containing protein n=1 Tax=Nocardia brasiliensis TaxID=37326 RepID=UPI003673299E